LGALDHLGETFNGLRADIQRAPAVFYRAYRHLFDLRIFVGAGGYHQVNRQADLRTAFFQQLTGQLENVILNQRIAHWVPLGLEKGVGHRPADQDRIGFTEQVADDANLVADLRAAEDGHKRPLRVADRLPQVL